MNSVLRRALAALILGALLAGLPACGPRQSPGYRLKPYTCFEDQDCPSGQECVNQHCVDTSVGK